MLIVLTDPFFLFGIGSASQIARAGVVKIRRGATKSVHYVGQLSKRVVSEPVREAERISAGQEPLAALSQTFR